MIIRFQLSLDDVRCLNQEQRLYVWRRFADHTPYRIWLYLLAPISVVAVSVLSGSFPVGVGSFVLYWGTSSLINRWTNARYLRNYYTEANFARSLAPIEVELFADQFVIRSPTSTHEYLWHSFLFIRETSRYVHLFFSAVAGIGITKSAFGSEVELKAFRTAVEAHQTAGGWPSRRY